jgi:hypothetical protein
MARPSGAKKSTLILVISTSLAWLVLACAGLGWLLHYENTPGEAAPAPGQWPSQSQLLPSAEHATLVMLVHPHCPCSRASVGELSSIMAHSQGRLTAYVLFLKPEGFSDDWEKTDLWRSAEKIPGVTALVDVNGREAINFQSLTSGQTLLYDRSGRLVFQGGITASRGHSGDNAGRSAIISIVNTGSSDQKTTPVFGCPLLDPQSACRISGKDTNAQ